MTTNAPSPMTPGHASNPMIEGLKHLVMRRESLLIGLIFVLAFIVRAQLMRYELFFEFDSYWHARMVSYILQGQPLPTVDPLAYYQTLASATFSNPPVIFWYASAAIYKLFTLNAPYDFELWVFFVKILPALFGALTCVAMYFLGKEIFPGKHAHAAGVFAGIFSAIVPSFVYRTMGGFYEDDSLGFLWMVIGFTLLLRATHEPALHKKNLLTALLAGISFAAMVLTWSAFNILTPILLAWLLVQFLAYLRDHHIEKMKAFSILWGIAFGCMAIAATAMTQTFWLSQLGSSFGKALFASLLKPILETQQEHWVVIAVMVLFFGLMVALYQLAKRNMLPKIFSQHAFTLIVVLLTISPLLIMLFNVSLQTSDVLGQTVGEESPGKNYFGNKYSMLALFAIIGLPAMGFLLIRRTEKYAPLILALTWLTVAFFMAWGKLKFTFYWGLPLALTGAIVLVLALQWMASRSTQTQKIVVFGAAFMLLCGIAAGTLFVTQNVPNIETSPGWKEATFWAEKNLPTDAIFMNWWDEGHWISFLANRKVIIDNRNADTQATAKVAQFMLSQTEEEAVTITRQYNSTHLFFGDDLLSKLGNLGFFAYNTTNGNDPRLQGFFGTTIQCSERIAPLTKEKTFQCGSNSFTPAEMSAFPTTYSTQPNQLQDGQPLYIYREANNSKIYAFSQKSNKTMLVRLWMQDPSITKYKLIYKNYGGVRIYEVVDDAMTTQ